MKGTTSLLILLSLVFQPALSPADAAKSSDAASAQASNDNPSEQEIEVEVLSSGKELEPIAVPALICTGGVSSEDCALLLRVLRRDLDMSGLFQVTNPDSYLVKAVVDGSPIPFVDWFNVGARYLVQGTVKREGGANKIALSLYEVGGKERVPVKVKAPRGGLAGFAGVHAYVNAFMKTLTGHAGLFGTTIYFIEKDGAGHKNLLSIRFGDLKPAKRIANGGTNLFPSMGPGGKVVHTRFYDYRSAIFLGDDLLTDDEHQYRSARYSPSRKQYVTSVDTGEGQSDIWLLSAKGKLLKNLTESEEDEVSPRWTPGGGHIVYVSNRTGTPQINVMASDGSGKRRVTMMGRYNVAPEVGIGSKIIFNGMDEFVYDLFSTDMYGNMERITQNQGSNHDPAWSPDGRYIVFVSKRSGGTRLYVGTEDGRWQFPLIGRTGQFSTPFWTH
jgi:TolB protein